MALLKSDLSTTTTTAATTSTAEDISVGPARSRASGEAESREVGASPPGLTRGKDGPMGLSSIRKDPQDHTVSTFADQSTLYPLQSDDSGQDSSGIVEKREGCTCSG